MEKATPSFPVEYTAVMEWFDQGENTDMFITWGFGQSVRVVSRSTSGGLPNGHVVSLSQDVYSLAGTTHGPSGCIIAIGTNNGVLLCDSLHSFHNRLSHQTKVGDRNRSHSDFTAIAFSGSTLLLGTRDGTLTLLDSRNPKQGRVHVKFGGPIVDINPGGGGNGVIIGTMNPPKNHNRQKRPRKRGFPSATPLLASLILFHSCLANAGDGSSTLSRCGPNLHSSGRSSVPPRPQSSPPRACTRVL